MLSFIYQMKSFYTTEQIRLYNNIEKPNANSVVLLQWNILDTVTGLYKNNINKHVPPMYIHTYKTMHLMQILMHTCTTLLI